MSSRILITGGSGFIGREIGRLGVADGVEIRSLSRSGRPAVTEPWVDEIEWHAVDLFEPDRWRDQLDGCDAVIHTVGILRESLSEDVTFERLNGDSAILAAREAERADVPAFVLLSVAGTPPFVSDRSRTAKRRAENVIADLDVQTTVLRPGLVYGEGTNQGHFPQVVNTFFQAIDNRPWLAQRVPGPPSLGVRTVARVALHAALVPDTPELLEVDEISTHT
jgi:uncharacterized protein YbjT (DUF2867 family)